VNTRYKTAMAVAFAGGVVLLVVVFFAHRGNWFRPCAPGPLSEPIRAPKTWEPFLYRVEGQRRGYLFGTVHASSPQLNGLPKSVQWAQEESSHSRNW